MARLHCHWRGNLGYTFASLQLPLCLSNGRQKLKWRHGDARYKYTEKERDSETGYDYFGARYYDARVGRWMSVDPLAEKYPATSTYAYVAGNPLAFVDHDGKGLSPALEKQLAEATPRATWQQLKLAYSSASATGFVGGYSSPTNAVLMKKAVDFVSSVLFPPGSELLPGPGMVLRSEKALEQAPKVAKGLEVYEVGTARQLIARSPVGDGLEVHHVGQKHAMEQLVSGYDSRTAPAIVLTKEEHAVIPKLRGEVSGTARDLLARDVKALRKYTEAPNEAIEKLIGLNKIMYPEMRKK